MRALAKRGLNEEHRAGITSQHLQRCRMRSARFFNGLGYSKTMRKRGMMIGRDGATLDITKIRDFDWRQYTENKRYLEVLSSLGEASCDEN